MGSELLSFGTTVFFFCAKRAPLSLHYIYSTSVGNENILVTLKVIEKDVILIGCV